MTGGASESCSACSTSCGSRRRRPSPGPRRRGASRRWPCRATRALLPARGAWRPRKRRHGADDGGTPARHVGGPHAGRRDHRILRHAADRRPRTTRPRDRGDARERRAAGPALGGDDAGGGRRARAGHAADDRRRRGWRTPAVGRGPAGRHAGPPGRGHQPHPRRNRPLSGDPRQHRHRVGQRIGRDAAAVHPGGPSGRGAQPSPAPRGVPGGGHWVRWRAQRAPASPGARPRVPEPAAKRPGCVAGGRRRDGGGGREPRGSDRG
ncbi:MAG: hypothetical protein MZV64_30675 [Ignavibacteriales bacterium]|nr:hypothetical protein [Ignavibacteriales bacterium]